MKMNKRVLLGAIASMIFSISASALENEDCKFVDALNQPVAEIKVSCVDKQAEYTYIDSLGDNVSVTIDILEDTVISISPEPEFTPPTSYTLGTDKLYKWVYRSNGDCNSSSVNYDLNNTLVYLGSTFGTTSTYYYEKESDTEGHRQFTSLPSKGAFPSSYEGMFICLKDLDGNVRLVSAYRDTASQRMSYLDIGEDLYFSISGMITDTGIPKAEFIKQFGDKYHGELRAVPLY